MNYALIDTDILSYFLNGDISVSEKVQEYLTYHNTLSFSEITYFEVLAGLEYKQATKKIIQFELFSANCQILNLSTKSIKISSNIYGELRRGGLHIGTPDLLIAGIAIENEMELITNNVKHYQIIKELKINNWKV